MKRMIVMALPILLLAASAQAKNYVYGDGSSTLENPGYKLFSSEKITNTVDRLDLSARSNRDFCAHAGDETAKLLGDPSVVRSDRRLSLAAAANVSYGSSCSTYYSVVSHLKSADDARRLWLLFADALTDDYVVETVGSGGATEDTKVLVEMKRLAVVSKCIEFFTKNRDWKLNDYTFLSQAFKSRKGKSLSPAYSRFVAALLTGDEEAALRVVKSVNLDDLGNRFSVPDGNDDKRNAGPKPVVETKK